MTITRNKISIFLLFCIVNVFEYVNCDYNLTILLLNFDNGQGFLANGAHCNPFWWEGNECNIAIKVCIDYAGSQDPNCTIDSWQNLQASNWHNLGQVTNNSNNITFQEAVEYNDWYNPTTFENTFENTNGSYQGFSLSLVAVDINITSGETKLIDNYTYQFADKNSAQGFFYYSHPRPLSDTLLKLEPTLTGVAWLATGNVLYPPPTQPATTISTTSGPVLPVDCQDPSLNLTESGNVTIKAGHYKEMTVYCDYRSQGRAYTVIQSRGPSYQIDFNQSWTAYQEGFGVVEHYSNFFLGLENLYYLTHQNIPYGLRIDLCCGNTSIANNNGDPWYYVNFTVGNSADRYKLNAVASGGIAYGLNSSNSVFNSDIGSVFSTWDNFTANTKQNISQIQTPYFCSVLNYPATTNTNATHQGNIGGWWFGSCMNNLNGHYYDFEDSAFSDPSTCQLNLGATGLPEGTGIEMALYNPGLPKISYTKVRMALYRLSQGEHTPPPVESPDEFCQMLLRLSLCTLFMLIIQLWCISCEHKILITLNSLEIDGNLDNGQPCNPYRDAGVNCAPRPKICIEPWFDTDPSPDFCTYRTFIDLGILNVNSSFIFTFDTTSRPVYGAWINPNAIKFVNHYHGFFVKMQIYNADRTNYQLIEKFYWPIKESLNGVENGTADSSTGPNAGNFRTKVNLSWWTNNTVANIPSTTPSLLTTTTHGGGGVSTESTIAVSGITTEAVAPGSTDAPPTGTTTTPGEIATAASGSTDILPTGTTTTPGEIATAASGPTDTPLTGTTTGGTTDILPTPTNADTTETSINTEATESSTLSASSVLP